MEDEQLFELINKMYADMQQEFENLRSEIKEEFNKVNKRINELENRIHKSKLIIENDVKPSLKAIFDKCGQNSAMLDIIEKEVSMHDNLIL